MDTENKTKRDLIDGTNRKTCKHGIETIRFDVLLKWDKIYNNIYVELSYETEQVTGRENKRSNKNVDVSCHKYI